MLAVGAARVLPLAGPAFRDRPRRSPPSRPAGSPRASASRCLTFVPAGRALGLDPAAGRPRAVLPRVSGDGRRLRRQHGPAGAGRRDPSPGAPRARAGPPLPGPARLDRLRAHPRRARPALVPRRSPWRGPARRRIGVRSPRAACAGSSPPSPRSAVARGPLRRALARRDGAAVRARLFASCRTRVRPAAGRIAHTFLDGFASLKTPRLALLVAGGSLAHVVRHQRPDLLRDAGLRPRRCPCRPPTSSRRRPCSASPCPRPAAWAATTPRCSSP